MTPVRLREGLRDAGGQGLVEFALTIPIFLLLLIALFDMGRAVFAYNTLTNAAREGARIAIVNQDKPTIIERAKQQTAIVELNDPSVTVGFFQMASDGSPDYGNACNLVANNCLAIVSFEATYQPITPIVGNLFFGKGLTFTAESILNVEYYCPNSDFPTGDLCPKQP
jgi:hypothetical protein